MEVPLKNSKGELDSYTGVITYDITAHTPIYIRSGKDDNSFTNVDGRYFIPGSSLKGCFRSVLEIISFGRMNGRMDCTEFQFRDLQNRDYKSAMTNVYCGFLDVDSKRISHYGKPYQINYDDLIQCDEISNQLSNERFPLNAYKGMSAVGKYAKFGLVSARFQSYINRTRTNNGATLERTFCRLANNGERGYVAFSGQMQNKRTDFVIFESQMESETLEVDEEVLYAFEDCYPDYKMLPNKDSWGILVFFTLDDEDEVKTIGLCYNHRYIAQNNTEMAIPEGLYGDMPDLADVMFGYVNKETKEAVKGRVQVQPAFISRSGEAIDSPILTVLGSPRPSFYPTYLQNHATWDATAAIIAGYKRYPVKNPLATQRMHLGPNERRGLVNQYPSESHTQNFYEFGYRSGNQDVKLIPRTDGVIGNFDTLSLLKPLGRGTEFKGRITFFNLKKAELGALLSAMTFLGNEGRCFHSIGSAKAMGFGAVKISNISVKLRMNPTAGNELSISNNIRNEAIEAFKRLMRGFKPNYEECSRIQDLIAMAKDNSNISDSLVPPQLADFAPWKRDWNGNRRSFPRFTELVSSEE